MHCIKVMTEATTKYQNIEKKQIKVLIKSIYNPYENEYSYYLFLSPTNVGNEILHLFFKKLCMQFHISVWNNYLSNCQEELELTSAFCIYANRKMDKHHFIIGNKDQCVIDYSSLKRQIVSKMNSAGNFSMLFVTDESGKGLFYSYEDSTEYKLLQELKDCVAQKDNATIDRSMQWNFEQRYKFLNLHRYSLVIENMIKENTIDIDEFIPILDKHDIIDYYTAQKNNLYWAEPQSLFEEDIYPLDLAYMARNHELMFYLIKMKASKFSKGRGVRMDGASMQSDFITFMFENAKDVSELALIMKFMSNHSEQIEKETEIVAKGDTYSSRQCINSFGGENIIRTWYKCTLRLQNIEYLELLLKKYKKQLLGLLNTINPYTGNWLSMEKDLSVIDMDLEINKYIKKNIVPFIKSHEFQHTSYKDCGIWGFDARTGRPIRESDLYV